MRTSLLPGSLQAQTTLESVSECFEDEDGVLDTELLEKHLTDSGMVDVHIRPDDTDDYNDGKPTRKTHVCFATLNRVRFTIWLSRESL